MNELTKIAGKYAHATDKAPSTTYEIKHSYTEFYGSIFHHMRGRWLNVLEIGIRWGGSLLMWKDFFGEDSQIYGIDPNLEHIVVDLGGEKNVHLLSANAYDDVTAAVHPLADLTGKGDWKPTLELPPSHPINRCLSKGIKFDIIIDDGIHSKETQLFVLNNYRKILNPHGFICAEDVLSPENANWIIENFEGDKNRISLVDRTKCETAHWDERIIVYHG